MNFLHKISHALEINSSYTNTYKDDEGCFIVEVKCNDCDIVKNIGGIVYLNRNNNENEKTY